MRKPDRVAEAVAPEWAAVPPVGPLGEPRVAPRVPVRPVVRARRVPAGQVAVPPAGRLIAADDRKVRLKAKLKARVKVKVNDRRARVAPAPDKVRVGNDRVPKGLQLRINRQPDDRARGPRGHREPAVCRAGTERAAVPEQREPMPRVARLWPTKCLSQG